MESHYLMQTIDLPKTTVDPAQPYFEGFDPPEGYRLHRVFGCTDRPSRVDSGFEDERLTGVAVIVWEREVENR